MKGHDTLEVEVKAIENIKIKLVHSPYDCLEVERIGTDMASMIYYVSSNRLPEQMRIDPVLHSR